MTIEPSVTQAMLNYWMNRIVMARNGKMATVVSINIPACEVGLWNGGTVVWFAMREVRLVMPVAQA